MLEKLSNVVDIYLGITHTPVYVDQGVPFLSAKDISNGIIDFNNCKYVSHDEYDSFPAGAKPKAGDLLFCRVGTLGKPILINDTVPKFGSFVSLGFLRKKTNINMKYLKYWMESNNFIMQVELNVNGASQKNLNTGWLKNFTFNLCDVNKQNEIVHELDFICNLILSKNNELLAMDESIKSRFIEMFGDCKTKKPLEELTTKITDGSHNPPKGIEKSNYLMLSSQNVHNELDLTDVRYLTKEDFEAENKRTDVQEGDILLTIVGTIGRTHVVKENEKYTFQRSVGVIKPKRGILNGTFLSTYLHTEEAIDQLESGGHGSSQKGIYLKDVKKILIPVPEYGRQLEFENFVELIDKSKFVTD